MSLYELVRKGVKLLFLRQTGILPVASLDGAWQKHSMRCLRKQVLCGLFLFLALSHSTQVLFAQEFSSVQEHESYNTALEWDWGWYWHRDYLSIEEQEQRALQSADPLHWLAAFSGTESLGKFLDEGYSANVTDGAGGGYERTVLMEAAAFGRMSNIAYLIHRGADVNQTVERGETALHTAAQVNAFGTASLLIALGANVHAEEQYGWTPLHDATNSNESTLDKLYRPTNDCYDSFSPWSQCQCKVKKWYHTSSLCSLRRISSSWLHGDDDPIWS